MQQMPADAHLGLSSDDGWAAPGFAALVTHFGKLPAVLDCLAPTRRWHSYGTCTGEADTANGECRIEQQRVGQQPVDVIDMTPAAVARLLAARMLARNLSARCAVVGVNHGPNVGSTLLHSGTFGAALTLAWLGIPAVAISLDDVYSVDEANPGPLQFDAAAVIAGYAVEWMLQGFAGVCNINVPNNIRSTAMQIRAASIAGDAVVHRLPADQQILRDGDVTVSVLLPRSLQISCEHSLAAVSYMQRAAARDAAVADHHQLDYRWN